MKVEKRVHDAEGRTVGFIVDGEYHSCAVILNKIEQYSNVFKRGDSVVAKRGKLPIVTLQELHNNIRDKELKRLIKSAPFERDVTNQFQLWYSKFADGQALYVKGPRQVGKTSEVQKFAYSKFNAVLYVSLMDKKTIKFMEQWVFANYTPKLETLCEFLHIPLCEDNRGTVLIIGEIQASSLVFSRIRYLLERLSCAIIVTGSYLGIVVSNQNKDENYFVPAGSVFTVTINPLSFSEFAKVFNRYSLLQKLSIVGASAAEQYIQMTELYTLYTQIGGYPRVVLTYQQGATVEECLVLLKNLLNLFIIESMHYLRHIKAEKVLEATFLAALQLQTTERRGSDKSLMNRAADCIRDDIKVPIARAEVSEALFWLINNGVLQTCDMYSPLSDNLQLDKDRRCYFVDVGLLNAIAYNSRINEAALKGLIAETFVFNELRLICEERIKANKPCFAVYQTYELDFLLVDRNNKKWGIEVKSNRGTHPKSLGVFLKKKFIDEGVVAELTKGGVGKEYRTIPIYMVAERFPYDNCK